MAAAARRTSTWARRQHDISPLNNPRVPKQPYENVPAESLLLQYICSPLLNVDIDRIMQQDESWEAAEWESERLRPFTYDSQQTDTERRNRSTARKRFNGGLPPQVLLLCESASASHTHTHTHTHSRASPADLFWKKHPYRSPHTPSELMRIETLWVHISMTYTSWVLLLLWSLQRIMGKFVCKCLWEQICFIPCWDVSRTAEARKVSSWSFFHFCSFLKFDHICSRYENCDYAHNSQKPYFIYYLFPQTEFCCTKASV